MIEAEIFLKRRIESGIQRNQPKLDVIVGKGIHSKNGLAKLRPAIEKLCDELGLSYHLNPDNAGVLVVELPQGEQQQQQEQQQEQQQGQQFNQPSYPQQHHQQQQGQNYNQQQQQQQQQQPQQQSQEQESGILGIILSLISICFPSTKSNSK